MRLNRLVIILFVIAAVLCSAQTPVTLKEAVEIAISNNIELQKHKSLVNKSELQLEESARLPNPIINYTREDLKNNFINYNEWILSGSLPLNFLWERWNLISSNEKYFDANKLILTFHQNNIISEVHKSYVNLHNTELLYADLKNAQNKISRVYDIAKNRFIEGDISEYELNRILVEINKIDLIIKKYLIKKVEYKNELNLLLNSGNQDLITESFTIQNKSLQLNSLIDSALNNRADLKSIDLFIQSKNSQLKYNSVKIIPNINLTAGYKKQSDELRGMVIELNAEIPIFNRNQLKIEEDNLELTFLQKQKTFLQNKIEIEVAEALQKYEEFNSLNTENKIDVLENIFNSAAFAYELGEIELVDFTDAINTYVDGLNLFYEIKTNFYHSYFELEKVVSVPLSNFENKME